MAVNASRRLNADLDEGATDGKYRKNRPDTGGVVETTTLSERLSLHPEMNWGTWVESPLMKRPDGVSARRS